MEPRQILDEIEQAGAWLPLTTLRQAFEQGRALSPVLLEAVRQRAGPGFSAAIQQQRLAAFGVFFLAQHRERQLLEPLIRLFETVNPEAQDEWLFAGRICFFGHRLIAGVCPLDGQTPMDLAANPRLLPMTRAFGVSALGLQAAYGDIPRAEAVSRLRNLFKIVQAARDEFLDSCWVRTVSKVHCRELAPELQWFIASGRLDPHCASMITGAMQNHPDYNFESITLLEPMVDLFRDIFPREVRDGEVGLLPNGQIPRLELFTESDFEPKPVRN